MVKPRSFRIYLVTLIICLCLGILVVSPILNVVGPFALEISEIDSENNNSLEPVEADDDLVVTSIKDLTIAGLIFSKSRILGLNFQSASLLVGFPPPKLA